MKRQKGNVEFVNNYNGKAEYTYRLKTDIFRYAVQSNSVLLSRSENPTDR